MAILDGFPDLIVEVIVDGAPVTEYNDGEDDSPTATTRYIEARSGAEFAVRTTFGAAFPRHDGVEMKTCVDGASGRRLASQPHELYNGRQVYQRGVSYEKDKQWFRRNFCFTALSIVEEVEGAPTIADLRKSIESKGCITVSFRYITSITSRSRPGRDRRGDDLQPLGAIPEKALKGDARSHQATLNAPHAIGPRKPRLEYKVVDRKPFATFHFQYRSLDALRALRVVSDEYDNPIPLENRPENEMTPGQLREVVRRMRQREAENGFVKLEPESKERIKRERDTEAGTVVDVDEVTITSARALKRARVHPEVIVID